MLIVADELESLLGEYVNPFYTRDGWGGMIDVNAYGDGYALGSGGKDGLGPLEMIGEGGPTSNFNDAIMLSDGQFVQWPEGTHRR